MPSSSTATAAGSLNVESSIAPSRLPRMPPPAIVVTAPSGLTRRRRLFPVSATISVPSTSTAIPQGVSNRASAPFAASANPGSSPPAIVLTSPSSSIERIRSLYVSATKIVPSRPTATPIGPLNRASAPLPSLKPARPSVPAITVTLPVCGTIRLIVCEPVSATTIAPSGVRAIAEGVFRFSAMDFTLPSGAICQTRPASPSET